MTNDKATKEQIKTMITSADLMENKEINYSEFLAATIDPSILD